MPRVANISYVECIAS